MRNSKLDELRINIECTLSSYWKIANNTTKNSLFTCTSHSELHITSEQVLLLLYYCYNNARDTKS